MSVSWVTLARPFAAQSLCAVRKCRGGAVGPVASAYLHGVREGARLSWEKFREEVLPQIQAATATPPLCDACAHWNVFDGRGGWCEMENQWCTHARSLRGGCRPAGDKFEEREK